MPDGPEKITLSNKQRVALAKKLVDQATSSDALETYNFLGVLLEGVTIVPPGGSITKEHELFTPNHRIKNNDHALIALKVINMQLNEGNEGKEKHIKDQNHRSVIDLSSLSQDQINKIRGLMKGAPQFQMEPSEGAQGNLIDLTFDSHQSTQSTQSTQANVSTEKMRSQGPELTEFEKMRGNKGDTLSDADDFLRLMQVAKAKEKADSKDKLGDKPTTGVDENMAHEFWVADPNAQVGDIVIDKGDDDADSVDSFTGGFEQGNVSANPVVGEGARRDDDYDSLSIDDDDDDLEDEVASLLGGGYQPFFNEDERGELGSGDDDRRSWVSDEKGENKSLQGDNNPLYHADHGRHTSRTPVHFAPGNKQVKATQLKLGMSNNVADRAGQGSTGLILSLGGQKPASGNERRGAWSDSDSQEGDFGPRASNTQTNAGGRASAAAPQGPSELDTLILRHNIDYLVRAILQNEGGGQNPITGADFYVFSSLGSNKMQVSGLNIADNNALKHEALSQIYNYWNGKQDQTGIAGVYAQVWNALNDNKMDDLAALSEEIHAKTESKAPYMAQRLVEEKGVQPDTIPREIQNRMSGLDDYVTISPSKGTASKAGTAFAHLKHDYTPSGKENEQAVEMIKMSNTGLQLDDVLSEFNSQDDEDRTFTVDGHEPLKLVADYVQGHKGLEIGFFHDNGQGGRGKPLSKDEAKAVGKAVMANVSGLVANATNKKVMTAESEREAINKNRIKPK